jgi:hypothetical protein
MLYFFDGVKKLKIDKLKYNAEAKNYVLSFGNNQKFEFTSKREAKKFCNNLSSFFELKLLEIIKIYIEVHSEFYSLWFYFDSHHFHKQYLGLNLFSGFEKKLNNFSRELQTENGNFYLYHNFNYLIEQLLAVVDLISELHKKKSNNLELKNSNIIASRLLVLKKELNGLELEKQSQFENKIIEVLRVA